MREHTCTAGARTRLARGVLCFLSFFSFLFPHLAARGQSGQAPIITSQPTAQKTYLGGLAHFTVTASGSGPLSYQWRKDGTNLFNSGGFSGTDSPGITIFPARESDAGRYSVVVSSPYGIV